MIRAKCGEITEITMLRNNAKLCNIKKNHLDIIIVWISKYVENKHLMFTKYVVDTAENGPDKFAV